MSVTAETEQGRRRLTLRAHSRVHQVCHVVVGFRVLRVNVTLDLGFHVVMGVGRLTVQQESFIRQLHFTTHTQSQVQSSFLLDVAVRLCPVIVNSICIPNSCIFHIAKTGLLRCCLYTYVTTSRRASSKVRRRLELRIRCFSSSSGTNASKPASLISSFIYRSGEMIVRRRFRFLPPVVGSYRFCGLRHASNGFFRELARTSFAS